MGPSAAWAQHIESNKALPSSTSKLAHSLSAAPWQHLTNAPSPAPCRPPSSTPLLQRSRLLEANYLTSYVDRASERSKKGLKDEVLAELAKDKKASEAEKRV